MEGRLSVSPSREYLKQKVENVIAVCNTITTQVSEGTLPMLTPELLYTYDPQVLEKLPVREDVMPGELRTPFSSYRQRVSRCASRGCFLSAWAIVRVA